MESKLQQKELQYLFKYPSQKLIWSNRFHFSNHFETIDIVICTMSIVRKNIQIFQPFFLLLSMQHSIGQQKPHGLCLCQLLLYGDIGRWLSHTPRPLSYNLVLLSFYTIQCQQLSHSPLRLLIQILLIKHNGCFTSLHQLTHSRQVINTRNIELTILQCLTMADTVGLIY